jgi:hypothetical protein
MFGKSKLVAIFLVLLMVSAAGCSKTTNIFRWAHKGGSDSSQASLLADGRAALNDKDYGDALSYYNDLLSQNPNDSQALYGKAQALIGLGGLSLSELIANVIKEAQSTGSSPVIANSEFGAFFSRSQYTTTTSTDLLPETLNLPKLYSTALEVVPILQKIADGHGDGVIPADDPDVNINLAFFMTIQGVCRLLDDNNDLTPAGSGDLVQVLKNADTGWSVVLPDASALTVPKQQTLRNQAQAAIDDVFGISVPEELGAINYLEKAINKIKAKDGSPLKDLWSNINDMKASIKNQIDTNVNPKMDPSVTDIAWHPHASLLL